MSGSMAMKAMPCARSRRATIWPKRPKPAISTCGWRSCGIASYSRASEASLSGSSFDASISSSGVSAIDKPTMAVRRSRVAASSSRARPASPNTTKANSPPSASTAASRQAPRASSRPGRSPSANSSNDFTASSVATPAAISSGSVRIRCTSMPMPTAMKNSPSSRPSNGRICASSSCRYSDSANSTPARNAPRPALKPAACISQALPSTTSRAAPVNTSGRSVRAMTRNRWRSR